eukprot:403341377
MNLFDKDPKKQQKNFFKHLWDFSDENQKKVQGTFVNQEVEMWEQQLQQKAQQFMENEMVGGHNQSNTQYREFQQNQQQQMLSAATLVQQNTQYQQQYQLQQSILEKKILSNMPLDAPHWMQAYHLEQYGEFYKKWLRYETQDAQTGQMIPYWYSEEVQKSTWDPPMMILEALIINGIDSDQNNHVKEWENIEGTPFIKVKIQGEKKKDVRYLFIHRNTKRVFRDNPLQVVDKTQTNLPVPINQSTNKVLQTKTQSQSDQSFVNNDISKIANDDQKDIDDSQEEEDEQDMLQIEIEGDDDESSREIIIDSLKVQSKSTEQSKPTVKANEIMVDNKQEEMKEQEEEDSFEYDDAMLDPNAYNDDDEDDNIQDDYSDKIEEDDYLDLEDQKKQIFLNKPSADNESDAESSSQDESFEETPESQFIQSHQKEIAQFKEMLKDKKVEVFNTNWLKELPKVIHDYRCRLIPQQYRETVFQDYIKNVDKDKQSGKPYYDQLVKEDKEFLYTEFNSVIASIQQTLKDQSIQNFQKLLRKLPQLTNQANQILNANTQFKDIKSLIKKDQAYSQLKSKTQKQQLFDEYMLSDILTDIGSKRARLVAIGGHDEEVKKIDRQERKRQKIEQDQCVDKFKELLQEKIIEVNIPWREAQKRLQDDPRFNSQFMTEDQKFEIFKDFMREQFNRRRKDFRDLLDDYRHMINPFSSWDTVKDSLQDDQRYKDFPERNRLQTFEQHKQYLDAKLKKDFLQFVTDTLTKMTIMKYRDIVIKGEGKLDDVIEELTEIFELKDERFMKYGMYYEEERQRTLIDEVKKCYQIQ